MEQMLTVLLVAVVVAWALNRLFAFWRRQSVLSRPGPDLADAAQQLTFVSRVAFERQPLLNKSEFQILLLLEDAVRAAGGGHRVMAQTCLGEFLRPARKQRSADSDLAYRSINSKRADFLVVDRSGLPVLVVEYHGIGHFQGNAKLRDAVKREALRSAGVGLIEVPARMDSQALTMEVRKVLRAGNGSPSVRIESLRQGEP
jgi:hypothetical protein